MERRVDVLEMLFVAYVWLTIGIPRLAVALVQPVVTFLKEAIRNSAFWTGAVLFVALLILECNPAISILLAASAGVIRAIPLSVRLIQLFVVLVFFAAVLRTANQQLVEQLLSYF